MTGAWENAYETCANKLNQERTSVTVLGVLDSFHDSFGWFKSIKFDVEPGKLDCILHELEFVRVKHDSVSCAKFDVRNSRPKIVRCISVVQS